MNDEIKRGSGGARVSSPYYWISEDSDGNPALVDSDGVVAVGSVVGPIGTIKGGGYAEVFSS